MCGIAGELNFSQAPSQEAVARMTLTLAHRGPDASGFFDNGPVAFGHRRLSILDVAGGVQPMTRNGVTLVFNGQAYNHPAVRAELEGKGHVFTTRSDTEVVLRAYLQWGEDFAQHLDGMFALGLWDAPQQKLLLARDRLGKKPLYYALAQKNGWVQRPPKETLAATRLVFGSELKALVAHGGVPREVSPDAVAKYLAVEYVPAPYSIFKAIFKLPAAHVAVLDRKGFTLRRFWDLPAQRRDTGLSDADAAPELLRLLDGAVARRLVADVPVGVFLSGGVDSTGIAALAVRHKQPLSTFSIGFSEASFDESSYATLAAQTLGTEHHTERLSGDACVELLPSVVAQMDEPFADPSILPTFLLSRFVRKHVIVALAGDGGDELFAGYDTFLAHRPAAWLAALPRPLLALAEKAVARLPASSTNMSLDFRLKQLFRGLKADPALRHQAWIGALSPPELRGLLTPDFRNSASEATVYEEVYEESERARAAGVGKGSVDEALRFFLTRYLADDILVKADRASMMASLEVRAPFLDTAVVEFALGLPWQSKLSLRRTKRILKRALKGIVPDVILKRPKKGFGIPTAQWIRGPLRPLFEELFSARSLEAGGIIEPRAGRALLQQHLDHRADLRKPLWTVAMLLLWQRQWGGQGQQ